MKKLSILLAALACVATAHAADAAPAAPADPQARFDALDKDHDGAVSRDEAKADPMLAKSFEKADADKNGKLDAAEFAGALSAAAPK